MVARFFGITSSRQHEFELHNPALSEELRIRDILDGVGVMTSGAFVAAYELSGIYSYYHTEEQRNRAKESLEAVLRSMPERKYRDAALVVSRVVRQGRQGPLESTVVRIPGAVAIGIAVWKQNLTGTIPHLRTDYTGPRVNVREPECDKGFAECSLAKMRRSLGDPAPRPES